MKPGDKFAVRGPYGNGFPMESYYGKNLVFVAGGIGLIPLRSCIVYALKHRDQYNHIQIFLGAKTPQELMYVPNLREWEHSAESNAISASIAAMASGRQRRGGWQPVQQARRASAGGRHHRVRCGPPVMFRFVIKDLLRWGLRNRTSSPLSSGI